ncbi:MAG: copper chaperone PCu(A)C [Candidatus Dactylopiibacterium sp.]|nr:copper chaperone PCu(A)C [Candidatus Dactylopiibacterium sp.]
MTRLARHLACLALCALPLAASAHDYVLGALHIDHPWARATPSAASTGGGFLAIDNRGAADRLVSATTPVAEAVELHTMRMEGNIMRMQKLERGIAVPAGQRTVLAPGGLHLMFMGLKTPLKQGESFPLRLHFEQAGEIEVSVKVEALGASAAPAHEHKH